MWTSVATGVLPGVHGITDFVVRRDGERIPVTSNLRRAPAIWNLAPQLGFTNTFVNWYVTWPAEPTLGVIISDRADLPGLDQRVFPEELTALVDSVRAEVDAHAERDVARFTRQGAFFGQWRQEQWGQVRRSLRILDDVVRHDLVTLETARAVITRHQSDVTALYFRGNDNTQHLFWKYRLADRGERIASDLYPELEIDDVQALAPVVERYYDFADELLGETLAMLDPATAVLVVSDHGFLTNSERSRWFRINRLLELGDLAELAPGGGGAADSAASVVWDPVEPTIDARRILRPGGASENPARDLERAQRFLEGLRTDVGEELFVSTALGEDARGPRLAVVFARRLEGDRLVGESIDVPVSEFHAPEGHSGDHRMNGFLLAAGGPFRQGVRVNGSRAVDLAPTVLHLVGAPVALDMEGVVLTDLLSPEWLREHPVRAVDSYGLLEDDGQDAISTEADERIREELEALGYLR
ncbi:MAG: hypothetical protein DHS20C21_09110 [Gemmatimonadota bacterium]|nr:MAG: hypothetical protein DHS20C21_09110 [Gemmatimonadota bacterium]